MKDKINLDFYSKIAKENKESKVFKNKNKEFIDKYNLINYEISSGNFKDSKESESRKSINAIALSPSKYKITERNKLKRNLIEETNTLDVNYLLDTTKANKTKLNPYKNESLLKLKSNGYFDNLFTKSISSSNNLLSERLHKITLKENIDSSVKHKLKIDSSNISDNFKIKLRMSFKDYLQSNRDSMLRKTKQSNLENTKKQLEKLFS